MDPIQVKKLLNKYLNNECTPRERELLENYLESFQNGDNEWSELNFDEKIKSRVWSRVAAATIEKERAAVRMPSFFSVLKYAAAIAGLAIGLAVWINLYNNEDTLTIDDDKVVLRTGTGTYNEIDVNDVGQITNDAGETIASQEGDLIVYQQTANLKELVYNEIEVPRGKTIRLVLSDGTSVHLNASTVFRFPVNFIEGQDRKVYLNGEAYFEVARDTSHPFVVDANDMDVRVLGTHFNVSAYDGSLTHAVLLEGSVAVQMRDSEGQPVSEQVIVPGQKASFVSGNIEVKEVNVDDYVGWRNDILIFNDEPFADIIQKIERKYNVDIKNNYRDLAPVRFNGKFKDETVIDLLETFKESAGFDYHISENKVIIKKK